MNKITLLFVLIYVTFANAQSSWKKIDSKNYKAKTELEFRKTTPNSFDLYSLDTDSFLEEINNNSTINIPINGEDSIFSIKESSIFTNELALKYGYIKSFSLKGIDDKTATGKISFDTQGIHLIIFSGNQSTIYIDPYTKDKSTYISYKKEDVIDNSNDSHCLIEDDIISKEAYSSIKTAQKTTNDGIFRTYRLALACTIEYAAFHINNQNVNNGTDTEKQAAVLSAMNTTMTRINGIFEKELAVSMSIVINSDGENELIFIDSDELSNDDAGNLIDESQEICDDIIGQDNYDIGHTFSTGAGGLAGLGVVCLNGQKGSGVTGSQSPIGDSFDIDFVAHELGHQFGANHTFNGSLEGCSGGNRNSDTAVEPGSGSTIMAYAGICGSHNIQNNSDDYFHTISITQMLSVIQNTSCATETSSNNTAPNANAGNDVSVPVSTPLKLKGEASDEDNDSLTYCWEQIDNEITTTPPLSTNTAGASFRSFSPISSANRYLPTLSTVISGSTETEWEVIPSVAREMNFSLLVRDNNSNGGATGRDDMTINFIETNPFIVTSQTTDVSWEVGSTETITWDKSTTDEAPINCNNVKISLSIDGGLTFPIILSESTPNDGSHDISVPNQLTSNARIMVEGVDTIFYNVNTTDFSIISSGPIFVLSNASSEQEICSTETSTSISYLVDVEYINGFSETVTFSIDELPNDIDALISPSTINESSQVTITLNNLENLDADEYIINLNGTSTSISNSFIELPKLIINSEVVEDATLSSPENNTENLSTQNLFLEWTHSSTDTATLFDIDIATDIDFNTIILSEENLSDTNYTYNSFLDFDTTYYWRVKSKNNCGEGNYSSTYNFTTTGSGYCNSNFSFGGDDDSEFISNVTFGTIDNTSSTDNTDDTKDGYEDFTNISTPLIIGTIYTISVTFDPVEFRDHCYVFIDWNNDTRFDITTERYDLGSISGDEATTSLDITIPDDAVLGETRMRVTIEYFDSETSYGEGACTSDHNSVYGETEDYSLIITNSDILGTDDVFDNFSIFPNPVENTVFLTFDVVNTEENIVLQLSDTEGKIVKSVTYTNARNTFNSNLDVTDIQAGIYFLHIENGRKQTTKKIIVK